MPDAMFLLRLYLLAGLVLHKAVWELLKRRPGARSANRAPADPFRLAVKVVKVSILLGLMAQTLLPEVLPIAAEPGVLRAAGIVISTLGLLTAILARLQLGDNWADIETPEHASRQALVANGIYRLIRHPIYIADLALLIGFELALNSWLVLLAMALAPVVLRQAIREEQALAAALPGYDDYCRRTRRFIPYVV